MSVDGHLHPQLGDTIDVGSGRVDEMLFEAIKADNLG